MAHTFDLGNYKIDGGFVAGGRKPKANDRRRILRELYGSWFDDNGLKLGRDYYFEFIFPNTEWRYAGYSPNLKLTLYDDGIAALFKLQWVNV